MEKDIIRKLKEYLTHIPAEGPEPKTSKDMDKIMSGYEGGGADGSCFVMEKRIPASYIYGGAPLSDMNRILIENLTTLFGREDDIPQRAEREDFLFFDLETTGLQGGVGTLAFLMGTGYFEGDYFVIKQYFLRDFDEEISALTLLKEQMAVHANLVTFNGKAFDMNLIETRYIYNHIKPPSKEIFHMDLLYPSRNIWRHGLESCSLTSLEENILKEYRVDDIPGYAIPSVYFKYLTDRDATELKTVIEHNRRDILSMVALLIKISQMVHDPVKEGKGSELIGLAGLFRKRGSRQKYIECLDECILSDNRYISGYGKRELAVLYKKNKNYKGAVACWEEMVEESNGTDFFSLIELAKYYEHREKKIKEALDVSLRAYNSYRMLGKEVLTIERDLIKRIERLKRKGSKIKNA